MQLIALDVDSTLAATNIPTFEVLEGPDHGRTYDDIESWDWPIETWGVDGFLNAIHGVWVHQPLAVPAMEPGLAQTVDELLSKYIVHIVTHQPLNEQVSRGKRAWLAYHGIEYDEFVAVSRDVSKADLEYDVYIDDKPRLVAEVEERTPSSTVMLRDQRYNRSVTGPCHRVESVREATDYLLNN